VGGSSMLGQRRSLGDYFLDTLFTDIDSLELYAEQRRHSPMSDGQRLG